VASTNAPSSTRTCTAASPTVSLAAPLKRSMPLCGSQVSATVSALVSMVTAGGAVSSVKVTGKSVVWVAPAQSVACAATVCSPSLAMATPTVRCAWSRGFVLRKGQRLRHRTIHADDHVLEQRRRFGRNRDAHRVCAGDDSAIHRRHDDGVRRR
jgi:hypothetical protein